MNKLKSFLGTTAAVLYFIFPMCLILLLLLIMPFGMLSDINSIRSSGFAGPGYASAFIGVTGFAIGLSLLIPPLRKMYIALPWLYPFTKIFFIDLVILSIATVILNYGYEINNEARHTVFFILMLAEMIIGRIAMCIYFKLKPARYEEKR